MTDNHKSSYLDKQVKCGEGVAIRRQAELIRMLETEYDMPKYKGKTVKNAQAYIDRYKVRLEGSGVYD